VDAWRVHKHDLRVGAVQDAQDSAARGLRARRDDAHLAPDEVVDQRAFADIRLAHHGYEA